MASPERHLESVRPAVSPWREEAALTELVDRSLGRRRGGRGTLHRTGRLHSLPGGSRHRAWRFRASIGAGAERREVWLVLRMPRRRSVDTPSRLAGRLSRMTREMQTLGVLGECAKEFHAPLIVCAALNRRGRLVGMVQTFLTGKPLPAEAAPGEATELLAGCAAAVHRLPVDRFGHLKNACQRKRWVRRILEAAPAKLALAFPEAALARKRILDWVSQPAGRCCVVHGDLRLHNVLAPSGLKAAEILSPGGERASRLAIVDWELARIGEPAVDLAAISRSHRQIGGADDGLERLLEAYRRRGGLDVRRFDVRMFELVLVLAWLTVRWKEVQAGCAAVNGSFSPSPEFLARELRSVLSQVDEAEAGR